MLLKVRRTVITLLIYGILLVSKQIYGRKCNPLPLPDVYQYGTQGAFNPAAVRHPSKGWVAVARYDQCYAKYCKEFFDQRSHPLIMYFGSGVNPLMKLAEFTTELWTFNMATFEAVLQNSTFQAADFRPFLWRDRLYVGHFICQYRNQDRMAISALDFAHRQLKLVQVLDRLPGQAILTREKNWGFLEDSNGGLLVFYSVLPCTVILYYESPRSKVPVLKSGKCYSDVEDLYAESRLQSDEILHNSGHPILVSGESTGGIEKYSYLAMVHTRNKKGWFSHWIVYLSSDTFQVERISKGPVLTFRDYEFHRTWKKGAVTVGSYHELTVRGKSVLRVFLGLGDKLSCWQDIRLSDVPWVVANSSRVVKISSLEQAFQTLNPM